MFESQKDFLSSNLNIKIIIFRNYSVLKSKEGETGVTVWMNSEHCADEPNIGSLGELTG